MLTITSGWTKGLARMVFVFSREIISRLFLSLSQGAKHLVDQILNGLFASLMGVYPIKSMSHFPHRCCILTIRRNDVFFPFANRFNTNSHLPGRAWTTFLLSSHLATVGNNNKSRRKSRRRCKMTVDFFTIHFLKVYYDFQCRELYLSLSDNSLCITVELYNCHVEVDTCQLKLDTLPG